MSEPDQTAKDIYQKAYDLQMKENNNEEAFKWYQKAAQKDPKYANAYFGMASC
jgi:hypothetical protein